MKKLLLIPILLWASLVSAQVNTNTPTITTSGWSLASSGDAILTLNEPVPAATSAALVVTGVGNCTNGVHLFRTTVVTATGQSTGSAASSSVTCDGTHKQVTVTIPTGSPYGTGRNVYATKAGGSTYFLVATGPVVADNTTTSYTFNIADGSFLTTTIPASVTARDVRFRIAVATGLATPGASGSLGASQLNITSQAIYDTLYASSATAWTRLAAGTTGQMYRQTATVPSWSTATWPNTVSGAGKFLRASGANVWAESTATLPDTVAAGDILGATGANAVGSIACSGTGKVLQSGSPATCTGTPSVTAGSGTQLYRPSGTVFAEYRNVANAADTNYVETTEYTLPANSLSAVGDRLEVYIRFVLSSAVSTKTFQCNIGFTSFSAASGFTGGVTFVSHGSTAASQAVYQTAKIHYVTSSTGDIDDMATFVTTPSFTAGSTSAASIDWTAALKVACIAKDGSSNAAAISIRDYNVTFFPKP